MTKDRKEARRAGLIKLIESRYGGKQSLLAAAVGVSANLISRYVRGQKGIGEEMRDKIELACGVPGWLDADGEFQSDQDAGGGQATAVPIQAMELWEKYRSAPDDVRQLVDAALNLHRPAVERRDELRQAIDVALMVARSFSGKASKRKAG